MEIINIELLLNALAFTATTLLGAFIYIRHPQSWTHRFFLLLAFLIDCYIVVNYVSLHPPFPTPENQLFWIRVVMFVTSFIGPTLVLFVHTFPQDSLFLKTRYVISMIGLMSASAVASLTPLVFSGIQYPNGEAIPIPGHGIFIFFADFIGLFILSFVILIYKYHAALGEEKKQLFHLLLGILFSFSLMGLSTVVFVVILKTSSFVFLGPIFPVILLAFIAYAIVKHQLFNIKVITTQIVAIVLVIVLFSKIFVPHSFTETLIDAGIFIITTVFAFLLIRSVIRDIAQQEKIEKLIKARSDFLNVASHQLRTPVSVITGTLSLLQEGMLDKLPAEKRKSLIDGIFIKSKKLTNIINDILQASEMDIIDFTLSNQIVHSIDLRSMIAQICTDLKGKAEEKHLTFEYPQATAGAPITVLGQQTYLEQAISNLVDNAIKYTPRGFVRIELAENEKNAIIKVSDSGIGIPLDDQPKMFGKFTRAKNAQDTYTDGSGLGLFIAKKVIEAHLGGHIYFESGDGNKGTTFIVEIAKSK